MTTLQDFSILRKKETITGRNYFSKEQIEELEKNKYAKKVSGANVQFTNDFKEEFAHLISIGTGVREALRKCKIDPIILGRSRINSLAKRIRTQAAHPDSFNRKENSSKGKKKKLEFNSAQEELSYYREYALRLEQELVFTKKYKPWRSAILQDSPRQKKRNNLFNSTEKQK